MTSIWVFRLLGLTGFALLFCTKSSDGLPSANFSETVSKLSCPDPNCSGHGTCSSELGVCACSASWAGDVCGYFVGAGLEVSDPPQGAGPVSSLYSSDQAVGIAKEGVCPKARRQPQTSSDQDSGDDLAKEDEDDDPSSGKAEGAVEQLNLNLDLQAYSCSGHGQCEAGICRCEQGFAGLACEEEAPCLENCNSPSGRCVRGVCVCEEGFAGENCGLKTCPENCWGHGDCDNTLGSCVCDSGWTGLSCAEQESDQGGVNTHDAAGEQGSPPPPRPSRLELALAEAGGETISLRLGSLSNKAPKQGFLQPSFDPPPES